MILLYLDPISALFACFNLVDTCIYSKLSFDGLMIIIRMLWVAAGWCSVYIGLLICSSQLFRLLSPRYLRYTHLQVVKNWTLTYKMWVDIVSIIKKTVSTPKGIWIFTVMNITVDTVFFLMLGPWLKTKNQFKILVSHGLFY